MGRESHDLLVILGVSFVLLFVAAIARPLPARRALAIDPIEALRCEGKTASRFHVVDELMTEGREDIGF